MKSDIFSRSGTAEEENWSNAPSVFYFALGLTFLIHICSKRARYLYELIHKVKLVFQDKEKIQKKTE